MHGYARIRPQGHTLSTKAVASVCGFAAAVSWAAAGGQEAGAASRTPAVRRTIELPASAGVRVEIFRYRAHDGRMHRAYVALPAWYAADRNPPLALVIAPHGRGASAESMLDRFGDLPALGSFALVSPEGQGRRLRRFSWGYAGQIDDLARMPDHVTGALPWLRIDRTRIYAFGTSMGGQEALLLGARHPRLLAGIAAFDSTVDFALQYRNFSRIPCDRACRRDWHGELAIVLRRLARREVGGTPSTAPRAYAARSPIAYAARLASSGLPIQLWWSEDDTTVAEPSRQSGALYRLLTASDSTAHVEAFVGHWAHARAMRATAGLPLALARFGLVPESSAEPTPEAR
jgi:pimeloyl-ACP methyl ester carboxylesterase